MLKRLWRWIVRRLKPAKASALDEMREAPTPRIRPPRKP